MFAHVREYVNTGRKKTPSKLLAASTDCKLSPHSDPAGVQVDLSRVRSEVPLNHRLAIARLLRTFATDHPVIH